MKKIGVCEPEKAKMVARCQNVVCSHGIGNQPRMGTVSGNNTWGNSLGILCRKSLNMKKLQKLHVTNQIDYIAMLIQSNDKSG